ncbi:putative bark agglutinin LECRPA3 [Medicago truncatula]|uniref:Legume lectin domain-containing protein n=2 Tax=Medicago truncatula TaxID=3880 RepID=I3SV11_MEDTR|nr:putative bark agglutinin LECRPA3 [Medicago truncatula]AFK44103.1 unknown [Medicago truncatula]
MSIIMSSKLPFYFLSVSVIVALLLATTEPVTSQKTTSFDFQKFTSGQSDLIMQGSTEIFSNGIMALTNPSKPNIGRVLYSNPVPIWDSTTGHVASFVASFSFTVEDIQDYNKADGVIFFLAPQDTVIPPNSGGSNLGVVDAQNAFNQFVGVEFDSYANQYDPKYPHIGIDVNSVISSRTTPWNRVSGSLVKVSIIYDSLSNTLSVAATDNNGQISTVAHAVDLKAVLPQNVRVGLSATVTSGGRQLQNIHSWSFTSTLA